MVIDATPRPRFLFGSEQTRCNSTQPTRANALITTSQRLSNHENLLPLPPMSTSGSSSGSFSFPLQQNWLLCEKVRFCGASGAFPFGNDQIWDDERESGNSMVFSAWSKWTKKSVKILYFLLIAPIGKLKRATRAAN